MARRRLLTRAVASGLCATTAVLVRGFAMVYNRKGGATSTQAAGAARAAKSARERVLLRGGETGEAVKGTASKSKRTASTATKVAKASITRREGTRQQSFAQKKSEALVSVKTLAERTSAAASAGSTTSSRNFGQRKTTASTSQELAAASAEAAAARAVSDSYIEEYLYNPTTGVREGATCKFAYNTSSQQYVEGAVNTAIFGDGTSSVSADDLQNLWNNQTQTVVDPVVIMERINVCGERCSEYASNFCGGFLLQKNGTCKFYGPYKTLASGDAQIQCAAAPADDQGARTFRRVSQHIQAVGGHDFELQQATIAGKIKNRHTVNTTLSFAEWLRRRPKWSPGYMRLQFDAENATGKIGCDIDGTMYPNRAGTDAAIKTTQHAPQYAFDQYVDVTPGGKYFWTCDTMVDPWVQSRFVENMKTTKVSYVDVYASGNGGAQYWAMVIPTGGTPGLDEDGNGACDGRNVNLDATTTASEWCGEAGGKTICVNEPTKCGAEIGVGTGNTPPCDKDTGICDETNMISCGNITLADLKAAPTMGQMGRVSYGSNVNQAEVEVGLESSLRIRVPRVHCPSDAIGKYVWMRLKSPENEPRTFRITEIAAFGKVCEEHCD